MIGTAIRNIRKRIPLTIAELAEQVDVSRSYISQLEHNRIDPSVSVLNRIAQVLQVPISAFFEEAYEEPLVLRRNDSAPSLTRISPSASEAHTQMEAFRITLRPGSPSRSFQHCGEACLYVESGSARLSLLDSVYELTDGDSIHLQANTSYSLQCTGAENALFYLCSLGSVHSDEEVFL